MRPRTNLLIAALGLLVPGLLCFVMAGGGDVTPEQFLPTSARTADPAPGAPAPQASTGSDDARRSTVAAPPRTRALRGRAVDSEHAPLTGVHVGVLLDGPPATASARCATRTGTDGTFVLDLEPGAPTALTLLLQGTGQAPAALGIAADAAAPQVELGDLVLWRGGTIAGSVLGDEGQPRPDAQVLLRPVHGPLLRLSGEILDELLPALRVDGEGRFTFASLPAGAYALEATAPGSQALHVPLVPVRDSDTTRLPPLSLLPGHTLRGTVFDPDGQPLAGAAVDLAVAGTHAAGRLRQVKTDASGVFVLDHLAPLPHHLRVAHPGLLAWERRDLDPRFVAHVDIRLERGATLRGRVREATTGRDIGDFRVQLRRVDDSRELLATGADARRDHEFTRLSAAAAALQRAAADPRQLDATLRTLASQEAQRRAERHQTWPFGADPDRVWESRGNPAFAFTGLEDGLWAVEVEAAGRRSARIGPVLVRAGAGPTLVDVAVPQ